MAEECEHQRAPAKLTVSLRVTGVRRDGMHLLDAEMLSLDLADELWFAPGDGLEVIHEEGLPPGLSGLSGRAVPSGDDNLVRRALRAVGRTAHVRLVKRIPAGGGLGGGSADAAAVLRWATSAGRPDRPDPRAWPGEGLDHPDPRAWPGGADLALAARLGSDVPFCLVGGRARVRGAGEIVEPLAVRLRAFLLVMPPFGVSTAAVYAAWDALGGPHAEGPNDLEPAALAVEPRLVAWRDALGEATGCVPTLAGSGSTWFVETGSAGQGLAETLVVAGEVGRLQAVRAGPPGPGA